MNDNPKCPISGMETILVKSIRAKFLQEIYSRNLQIDTKGYFAGIDKVEVYYCPASGYTFFHPAEVIGDATFYEKLQIFSWYYLTDKWEYSKAKERIGKDAKVLEIGCGSGDFLLQLQCSRAVGLEINHEAAIIGRKRGAIILETKLDQIANQKSELFDVVCSFQVLEHIYEVQSFISDSLECLKNGGKFIFCVPNNDSFIAKDLENPLNYPPHHMGLWNELSIKNLVNYFPIRLDEILIEPLQNYHVDWYVALKLKSVFGNRVYSYFLKNGFFERMIKKRTKLKSEKIKGHSIMAIFTKV